MKRIPAVFVVLLVLGCTPRQEPPELPPPPPGLPPAPGEAPPPGPPGEAQPGRRSPPPPPGKPLPPPRPFDESLLSGKEPLLEAPFLDAMPRDIRLGALSSGAEADAVRAFFEAAAQGGERPLDPSSVEPRWAAYLQAWARRAAREGLAGEVRAGLPQPDNGGAVIVPVRVIGKEKEWQGWVVLAQGENRWLVADVQVEARDRDTTPFDPESPIQPR